MLKKLGTFLGGLSKKKKLFLVLLAIFAVIFFLVRRSAKKKEGDVDTATIERGLVKEELVLSGEIKADEHANLTFALSGKISWIGVSEGDKVYKGQALAKLDTANLNSDFQRAVADLRDADATVDRVHDDVKDAGSAETFTEKETRTEAEVAKDKAYEAKLKAEENLRNATLYAPFAGTITSITNPYSGINIIYTASQIELVNPETIFFEVIADQTEVSDLSLGQSVNIVLDSLSEKEIKGKILFIGYTPMVDESGVVYRIKVEIVDENITKESLRIGLTGDAKFTLSQKNDVLFIPTGFLNSDKTGKYVSVDTLKNKVYVEIGLEGEERIEIEGDIKEGQTVVD